jgi:hypothetical protein
VESEGEVTVARPCPCCADTNQPLYTHHPDCTLATDCPETFGDLAREWGICAERDDLRTQIEELDSYRHEAIALRAHIEQLTEPCPDCAAIPHTPGTVAATCGKPGCYAGRVNRLKVAGDDLASAIAEMEHIENSGEVRAIYMVAASHDVTYTGPTWEKTVNAALTAWRTAAGSQGPRP